MARAAWEAYVHAVSPLSRKLEPVLRPFAADVSTTYVADLIGFYVLWHLEGGFEGLRQLGMSRSAIYRRINAFRSTYREHPDEAKFPGIELDIGAYQAYCAAEAEKRT